MEYFNFVRELRKESFNACPPDTQYAKEFEEQMQALVINFDIDDTKQGQEHPRYSITSTPRESASGLKCKFIRKANSTTIFDETERMEVPRKRKALDTVEKSTEEHELQGSFDSSEGICMHYDWSSSGDDIPGSVSWSDSITEPPTSSDMPGKVENVQRHAPNFCPFDAIQGEDSLLEPSADTASRDRFVTKFVCNHAKRSYEEANS